MLVQYLSFFLLSGAGFVIAGRPGEAKSSSFLVFDQSTSRRPCPISRSTTVASSHRAMVFSRCYSPTFLDDEQQQRFGLYSRSYSYPKSQRQRRYGSRALLLLSPNEREQEYGDVDDDGWVSGDAAADKAQQAKSLAGDETEALEAELRRLQQQQKQKAALSMNARKSSGTQQHIEEERDLFIPIFAVVSLAGLLGAYGYEMVRLYLRGELYLPFLNH